MKNLLDKTKLRPDVVQILDFSENFNIQSRAEYLKNSENQNHNFEEIDKKIVEGNSKWIKREDMEHYNSRVRNRKFIIDKARRDAIREEQKSLRVDVNDYKDDPKMFLSETNNQNLEDYQNQVSTLEKSYIDDVGLCCDTTSTPAEPKNNIQLIRDSVENARNYRNLLVPGADEEEVPDTIQQTLIKLKNERQLQQLRNRKLRK